MGLAFVREGRDGGDELLLGLLGGLGLLDSLGLGPALLAPPGLGLLDCFSALVRLDLPLRDGPFPSDLVLACVPTRVSGKLSLG